MKRRIVEMKENMRNLYMKKGVEMFLEVKMYCNCIQKEANSLELQCHKGSIDTYVGFLNYRLDGDFSFMIDDCKVGFYDRLTELWFFVVSTRDIFRLNDVPSHCIATELLDAQAEDAEAEETDSKYYTISVSDFKSLKKYFNQCDYNDMLDLNPVNSGVVELLNRYRLYDETFDVREYMGKYDSIKAIDEKTYEFEKNRYKDFYCEYRTFTIFYVDNISTYETSVDDLSIFDAIISVEDELNSHYTVDIEKTLAHYCVELGVSLKDFTLSKSFRLKKCIKERLRIFWEKRENEEN